MMDFQPAKKLELIEQNEAMQRMKNSSTPNPHLALSMSRPQSFGSVSMAPNSSVDSTSSAAQASLESLLTSGRTSPKPQTRLTGFLFGNIFSGATLNHPEGSVDYYLSRLTLKSVPSQDMHKCLQSLRITLSSAAVTWIRNFLEGGHALTGMESLLEKIIDKHM